MAVIIISSIVTLIVILMGVYKAVSANNDKDYINWEKYTVNKGEFKD